MATLAERLHISVPFSRWCVSRQDMLHFKSLVLRSIRDGQIVPTESDPFDYNDEVVGPTMYTVNEQFIKPQTALAGNMSWALMLHPEGRPCDLFITHAWQEGIFELIDKVTNSWPRGARHAYCCILSNPQNLDLGRLVQEPRESPFAKALHSADWVLVVPNRKCSIYDRIWCSYEAFLAYSWDKSIFTAIAPTPRSLLQNQILLMMLSVTLGAFVSCTLMMNGWSMSANVSHATINVKRILLLVAVLPCGVLSTISPYVGAVVVGFRYPLAFGFFRTYISCWSDVSRDLRIVRGTIYDVGEIAVFTTSIMDHVWQARQVLETKLLRQGYSGHVMNAQSSIPLDKERIVNEIEQCGLEEAVDEAVEILIRNGMSTPDLQNIACKGVKLNGVGYCKYSLALLAWWTAADSMTWIHMNFIRFDTTNRCTDHWSWYQNATLSGKWFWYGCILAGEAQLVLLTIWFLQMSRDRFQFACVALSSILIWDWDWNILPFDFWSPYGFIRVLNDVFFLVPLAIYVCRAGPYKTSQWRCIGLGFVRFIYSKNKFGFLGLFAKRSGPATESELSQISQPWRASIV